MKITDIEARYPRYDPPRWNWRKYLGPVPVWIRTDEGLTGVGLSSGGLAALPIINGHLKESLVGEDPLQVEERWAQMYRLTLPYGQKGIALMAMSGIDLALWDIRAKAQRRPLYQLFGSSALPDRIPVYVTGSVSSLMTRKDGVTRFKTARMHRFDEPDALNKNISFIKTARKQIGRDADLMVDAWCKWNVMHALRVMEQVRDCNIRWLEDPLPPEDFDGMRRIKKALPDVPLTLGNFEAGPQGFFRLIEEGLPDILQPDVSWMGGLTPTLEICKAADKAGKTVILHRGGEAWGLHLMISRGGPLAEFVLQENGDLWIDPPLAGQPIPEQGMIAAPTDDGFGVEFIEDIEYEP